MHIHIIPNRGSPPTVLLRESYREGNKVGKRTLANLSDLSAAQIEAIRAALRGETSQPAASRFEAIVSRAQGHVHAVALTMRRLGLASLIGSKSCGERELVLQVLALMDAAAETRLYALYVLAVFTGLRQGECSACNGTTSTWTPGCSECATSSEVAGRWNWWSRRRPLGGGRWRCRRSRSRRWRPTASE